MSNLNFEQKQACRTNPLAAYLAKRINWMILLVTVLNLCTVGLAALAAVYGAGGTSPEIVHALHLWAFGLLAINLLSGLVLMAELFWMRQHQISPESFCSLGEHQPPAEAVEEVTDGSFLAKGINHDWREFVQGARRFASYAGRNHGAARTAMEKEYNRSMEIQAKALADLVEALSLSIEEKQQLGFHGSQVGFRQKEMTTRTLQRVTRTAQEAIRALHGKGRRKPLAKS